MLNKFWFGIAFLFVACISAGVTSVTMNARQAKTATSFPAAAGAPPPAQTIAPSMDGLPMNGPVTKPIRPPMLTRDMLITRGHAEDKQEIADLLYTYIWYHDTLNGQGAASLFTADGIFETLWNNGGKTIEPNAGPTGRGCIEYGHDQIAEAFGNDPHPFVGHSHNQVTNVLIQVHGDTATLYANWTTIHSNAGAAISSEIPRSYPGGGAAPVAQPPNTAIVSHNGEYVSDLRRTPDGWRFVHHRAIEDEPAKFGTVTCEQNVINATK